MEGQRTVEAETLHQFLHLLYLLKSTKTVKPSKVAVLRVCMNSKVTVQQQRKTRAGTIGIPLGPRHPACSPGLVDHRFSEASDEHLLILDKKNALQLQPGYSTFAGIHLP